MDKLNQLLEEIGAPEEGFSVGPLHIRTLYPSLVIKHCTKIAFDRFIRSGMAIEDVDKKWAPICLALNCKPYEIVRA